jgi:hypothetical protein
MTKSNKHKNERKKDFQKEKLKVGKARPKNTNATDTSFAARCTYKYGIHAKGCSLTNHSNRPQTAKSHRSQSRSRRTLQPQPFAHQQQKRRSAKRCSRFSHSHNHRNCSALAAASFSYHRQNSAFNPRWHSSSPNAIAQIVQSTPSHSTWPPRWRTSLLPCWHDTSIHRHSSRSPGHPGLVTSIQRRSSSQLRRRLGQDSEDFPKPALLDRTRQHHQQRHRRQMVQH